jgi:CRP-like cAMP-binding protein
MTKDNKLQSGWLGDLPRDFVDEFIKIGKWVHMDQGQIVYCNGDAGTELYGIAHGTARMQIAMNEHEQRLGHIIGPGFWFGDNEFILGLPRIMEIEAATDLLLLQIERNDFLQLAQDFPDAWRWISILAAQHLIIAVGAVDDLMLSSSKKRVAAVLLRFTGRRLGHPKSPPIDVIPATQQDMAIATNLSRSSVGSILREMERKGDISIEYGAIVIRDAIALEARLL